MYIVEYIIRLQSVSTGVYGKWKYKVLNTLRPRQNGRHFADDTFKHIFLNENVRISLKISLKFVPKGPINNIPALVQIVAWRRPGDKPLSEPMMVRLPTHICVSRPQWVELTQKLFELLGMWKLKKTNKDTKVVIYQCIYQWMIYIGANFFSTRT